MEKGLGLKLERKTASQSVWIVDSVNEKPIPNSPEVAKELPVPLPEKFEVATIKPSWPDEQQGGRIANGQVSLLAMPLKFFINFAWDMNPNDLQMIVSAPKWLGEDKFDISAKAAMPENGRFRFW